MAPRVPADQPRMIDQRGRVAIPPEVLKELGLELGSYVVIEANRGEIKLVPVQWQRKTK